MPLPIADSILAMCDRIESALVTELDLVLAQRDTEEYPLPPPKTWIVGDETIDEVQRRVGSREVYGSIVYQPSRLEARASGDGDTESYNQVTSVAVSVVLRRPAGATMPTRNGRELLPSEWMRVRLEKYRGALLDVLPKHVPDGIKIHQLNLDRAGTTPPVDLDTGTYRQAVVVAEITQHVSVNVRA